MTSHSLTGQIEQDVFRAVMRTLASSVTVITSQHDGQEHGMTATAVCSVCAEPPTILIVVNRTARTHPFIDASGTFAVNILAEDQRALSDRFSGKMTDQFAGVDYASGKAESPVLSGTAAHLECKVISQSNVGTHTIFVGEVIAGSAAGTQPLLYHEGRHKTLAPG